MADITKQDMVLHRTERTTGGRMGASQITGGETDYLFRALTTIGLATGEIEIKGFYAWVKNNGIGQLLKSFLYISAPPTNPNVSVSLMSRRVWGDAEADWKGYISNFLTPAAPLSWFPYGTTIAGSEVIVLWGRPGLEPPQVGRTYIIRSNPNTPQQVEQAFTVENIESGLETFADSQGEYVKQLATVYLSSSIGSTIIGPPVQRYAPSTPIAQVMSTAASSGVRIYGISKLAQPASIGDQRLYIDSPSTQVIPAALDESNIIDQYASNTSPALVPAAGGVIQFTYPDNLAPGESIYLGSSALPGSVEIVSGPSTLTESGGQLKSGATVVATVDAEAGIISGVPGGPTYVGPLTVRFRPAANASAPQQSAEIVITQGNRGTKYNINLSPPPAPGTIKVGYMAGENWYALNDQGDGSLKGTSDAYGRANLSPSNTLAITCGYAPDVGSSIIIQWGTAAYTFDRSATSVPPAAFVINTSQGFSVGDTITWHDGIAARTATIQTDFSISGAATGTAYPSAKQILLRPSILPPAGTVATVHIVPRPAVTETFTGSATGISKEFALSHGDIYPGSIRVAVRGATRPCYQFATPPATTDAAWTDDGNGGLVGLDDAALSYVAGTVTLPLLIQAPVLNAQMGWSGDRYGQTGWAASQDTYHIGESTQVVVSYQYGDALSATTEAHVLGTALVDFLPNSLESIIGGGMRFTFGGKAITDLAGGLYADKSESTGVGVWVGSIDYQSRRATFQYWQAGVANVVTVQALATRYGRDAISEMVFRTPVAPIKPGSLSIRAVQLDGTAIAATANGAGAIADDGIVGYIVVSMGIVRVRFGQFVAAAGSEGQPWYRAQDVANGQIFKPIPVYADSVLYDAVSYTRAVLADLVIGIDTARIPGGRIDHIRKGDVVMVHHTDDLTVSSPVAGAAVDCGREYLERVWAVDANGVEIPAALTDSADELDAGIVHIATPRPSLTTYPAPWTVHHRISDFGTVNWVDRFGSLVLRVASGTNGASGLAHDYPEGAYVSSLLYIGDLGAADSPVPWTQALWGGVWSDSVIGNPADRSYDYLSHPIEVSNKGATLSALVALVFESSGTTYRCYIQGIGIIDTGVSIYADYSPINPITGVPFFTVRGNTGNGIEPWGAVAWPRGLARIKLS